MPICSYLEQHTVRTAAQQGWDKLNNGDLLTAAEEAGFERSVPRKIADAAETRLFALAASLVPSERRLVCERDRRFESSSLQRRVYCEPDGARGIFPNHAWRR